MGSPSARVRIAAIRVIGDLIMLLPHEVLRNNVAQLLVGLYPIIENCGKQEDQSAAALALNELLAQLKRPILDIDLERPSESDGLYGAEPTTQEASKVSVALLLFIFCEIMFVEIGKYLFFSSRRCSSMHPGAVSSITSNFSHQFTFPDAMGSHSTCSHFACISS